MIEIALGVVAGFLLLRYGATLVLGFLYLMIPVSVLFVFYLLASLV